MRSAYEDNPYVIEENVTENTDGYKYLNRRGVQEIIRHMEEASTSVQKAKVEIEHNAVISQHAIASHMHMAMIVEQAAHLAPSERAVLEGIKRMNLESIAFIMNKYLWR